MLCDNRFVSLYIQKLALIDGLLAKARIERINLLAFRDIDFFVPDLLI